MTFWFLLALGSATSNSIYQAFSNYNLSRKHFSKAAIIFYVSVAASIILFVINWLRGFPDIDPRFWRAVFITSIINAVANPLLLKAYQLGEFSSVFSMTLLTPVFLLITSFFLVGEVSSIYGILGVLLTVFGLILVSKNHELDERPLNHIKGIALGVIVAFLWSITTNFDKLSTRYSNAFFAPAVATAIIAFILGVYTLARRSLGGFKTDEKGAENQKTGYFDYALLLLLGTVFAGSNILHNSALLYGFVSYTIAVKRIGILFGVVWGWLFFKEKHLRRKLLGAAIAVVGVVAILFA